MMLDVRNLCSDEQDLAQVIGTYLSDRSIARGDSATDQMGNVLIGSLGKSPVPIFCQVTTTFAGASGTVEAQLVSADNEALSTNLVVHQSTGAIAVASLVAGYHFQLGKYVPVGVTKALWGFRYLIATTNMSAGKISAGVCAADQTAPGM